MLVLTRKVGEGIAIGENIRVVIMQVKGKQVRVGVEASRDYPVHREEIFLKIQEENRLAATTKNRSFGETIERLGGLGSAETAHVSLKSKKHKEH